MDSQLILMPTQQRRRQVCHGNQRAREKKKIEESKKGRVYWKPGKPHPLDVLFKELDKLRKLIPDQLAALLTSAEQTVERLHTVLEATQDADDPTALFAPTNEEARLAAFDRFYNRKHSAHLLTIFTIQRYKRLVGRMNAIQAALDLANGLLEEEEAFSPAQLTAWRNPAPKNQPEEEIATLLAMEPQEEPNKAQLRLEGINEPLGPLVGSVEQSRRLLREFEAHLPELRRGLVTGQGWFEVFYVKKYHYKPEVANYIEALIALWNHKIPSIPPDVVNAVHPEVARLVRAGADIPKELRDVAYNYIEVGPYVKYRWKENKQTYTISLGLDDDYPPYPFVPAGFSS